MQNFDKILHRQAAGVTAALMVAALGLSACGGSSTSASSHTNAAVASTRTASTQPSGSAQPSGSTQPSGSEAKPDSRVRALRAPRHIAPRAPGGLQSPGATKFREALSKFAACLRQNGVNVPEPNTSGRGPVFGTKGLQTNTPKFREAANKCRSVLLGAFGAAAHKRPGSRG